MKINVKAFAYLPALLCSTLVFAADDRAAQLLQRGIEEPKVAYEGAMMVTHWYGPHTVSQEVHVQFNPPRSFRREFLRPDGSVMRVVVSDGKNEEVRLVRMNKNLIGGAAKCAPKRMPRETEWGLLQKNYRLNLVGEDMVSGRPTWVVRLTPVVQGKLIQQLWLDQETGVILENKRFRPNGDFVVLSRFNKFYPNQRFDPSLFLVRLEADVEDHNFAPDFLSPEELRFQTGRAPTLPHTLPFGFEFESVDSFMVDGKRVDHARYTDGVSVLSVFETRKPVQPDRDDHHLNENGAVMHIQSHGLHYTAVADVSDQLLKEILAPLK